ncbi:MAG TPA: tetratricopeptide repeat protein [Chitinophagaceae bacterium]|nr:tetratricopeptide repeat protein [Chitinophagaceae bacterium]
MRKSPVFLLLICALGSIAGSAQVTPPVKTDSVRPPQSFAMILGISQYKYIRPLTYADKDAELFRDYLRSPGGGRIPDANIYCLLNEEAKAANFWVKGMSWLKSKQLKNGDRLFIYLAGHGDAIDQDEYFFLTYDCNPAGDKNNYIVTGNIQLYNLKSRIADLSEKGVEVIFVMDACRTNELPGGREGQQALNAAISEKKAGEIIMLATGAGQESLEDASIGNGHGLFTYYLVDGLTGLADSTADNQVSLGEIQLYVDKNVPAIARERFKKNQKPFICCNEQSETVIATVDTSYLRNWLRTKQLEGRTPGNSAGRWIQRSREKEITYAAIDTQLLEMYNEFNQAIRESRLTGKQSAEFFYEQLEKNYPGNAYTIDAKQTLAAEFINYAQTKINLYLQCRDASSIQKIRAQIDEGEKTDEINTSLDRMEKIARQEFYEVGNMVEKAINFIREDDPSFARSLEGRMYFFKARGYFGKERRTVDINKAFQYAYTALAADGKAAYILNTIASLHIDNNRLDSAIYYSDRAMRSAPLWRYPYVNLAYCYKSLNKFDSAQKYYRKAMQIDPENPDALVDLGHFYYSQNRGDSAIAYYEKALAIDRNNVYASNNLGWLYHDRKLHERAITYFKNAVGADPKFLNAYNGLAKSFFEIREFDSARIYYTQAFANYPDKSIVNIYIGNFYRDLKAYDSAKVYYRLAAEFDPNYEEAYNNLGRASVALKQYDSARLYYHRALHANPYSAFALINLGLVFKELKVPDSTYNYFQQAVMLEPGNPSILNSLGVIYGQDKNYDSAKRYFRRAIFVKPDYKPASNNLMKIFRDLNQLDSITAMLRSTSLVDPNSVQLMNDLGLMFLNLKRFDSARYYYRKALAQDRNNALLYNNMALVFREMKQYDSARIYLQRATQLEPENATVWINLAQVFRQLRQPDSAAYYFQKQLLRRTDPNAIAFQAVGSFYYEMKSFDSAIVYYKKALELDSTYLPAYNNIGASYMQQEKYDSALVFYRLAADRDPTYENASLNLGLLFHALQRYDSAIVHIRRAISLDTTRANNYFRLACSYALNNQPAEAVASLRKALEKGYKNFDALVNDPDLAGLKGNAEYEALLDKYVPGRK